MDKNEKGQISDGELALAALLNEFAKGSNKGVVSRISKMNKRREKRKSTLLSCTGKGQEMGEEEAWKEINRRIGRGIM